MALTLTELQAMTDTYQEKTTNDIYFRTNVLLYKLLGGENGSGKKISGGKTIQVNLEYDEANAGPYGNQTELLATKKEVLNAAFFPWAGYVSELVVDLEDQRQNSGDAAIVDLIMTKLKNAQKTLRSTMGSDIYNLRSSNTDYHGNAVGFLGLGDLFNTTSATSYAGIAEDDMDKWAANVTTTAEAISFSVMQAIRASAAVDETRDGEPDLYVTTRTLKDGFENTLHTHARYSSSELLNVGFSNILFDGAPVVSDNNVTSGYVEGLNTRYLKIYTHKDYDFRPPTWRTSFKNPDVKLGEYVWSGQLITTNRAAHCRHTNLTAS